jgi:hypothetical protein
MLRPNQLPLDECENLFSVILASEKEKTLAKAFDRLLAEQPLFGYGFGRYDFYWRARKCCSSDGFDNICEMVYPPPPATCGDGLNDQGSPVLYASTREWTALMEIDAQPGDFVHLVGLRLKQGE